MVTVKWKKCRMQGYWHSSFSQQFKKPWETSAKVPTSLLTRIWTKDLLNIIS